MASRANLAKQTSDAVHKPYLVPTEPFDDMHDDPRGPVSPLSPATGELIISRFDPVDRAAAKSRKLYESSAIATAIFGACAVLLAILELGSNYLHEFHVNLPPEPTLVKIELGAVVAMLGSWTIMWIQKPSWLARRHQAECYRQIKYQLLVRPGKWADRQWLEGKMKPVLAFKPGPWPPGTIKRLDHAVEHDVLRVPFEIEKKELPREDLSRLVTYYLEKRLIPQRAYLDDRKKTNQRWDFIFKILEGLSLLGVLAALGHAAWILDKPSRAAAFLLAAACFPVVAAYVRTLRSSFEFSRNKSRFCAAYEALVKLEEALEHDLSQISAGYGQPSIDASEVLMKLHWSEHILTTEHIEWLRLMTETEFLG
ncbi:MAG: hypothetical protein WB562_20510 [Candidatus Sulfotelmatobacter sp.]